MPALAHPSKTRPAWSWSLCGCAGASFCPYLRHLRHLRITKQLQLLPPHRTFTAARLFPGVPAGIVEDSPEMIPHPTLMTNIRYGLAALAMATVAMATVAIAPPEAG